MCCQLHCSVLCGIYCQTTVIWLPGVPNSFCQGVRGPDLFTPSSPPTCSSTLPHRWHSWGSWGLASSAAGRGSSVPPASRRVASAASLGREQRGMRQHPAGSPRGVHRFPSFSPARANTDFKASAQPLRPPSPWHTENTLHASAKAETVDKTPDTAATDPGVFFLITP